jgi:hypothetical protein
MDGGQFNLKELIPFAGAVLTGAVGGCVASIQHARTKRETVAAFAAGYFITGAFGGMGTLAAFNLFYPTLTATWSHVFLVGGGGGLVTAFAIAAGNLSMRVALRKFGFDIIVEVHRVGSSQERGEDELPEERAKHRLREEDQR